MTRRRWLALVVAPLVLSAAGGAYVLAPGAAGPPPPDTSPAALLLVAARPQTPLPGPAPTPAEADAFRRAQPALVRSEFVLNAAFRTPAVRDAAKGQADPVGWLAARVTAEYAGGGDVLRVGVAGLPPPEAAAVTNAVAEAYVREASERDRALVQRARRQAEDARDGVRQQLDRRRAAVAEVAKAAGLPPAEADHRAAVAGLHQERAGLRVAAVAAAGGPAEKGLAAALADVDARIGKAEGAGPALEAARAELGPLLAADAALVAEVIRLGLEANAPPRVQLLRPASAPGKE